MDEYFLDNKLRDREESHSLRSLSITDESMIDFCSNDYLGIVKNKLVEKSITPRLLHGSTGSRLLSGNYKLIEETEKQIASFHNAGAGLIFNSGYDANTGLLSCVAQKDDTIIYDKLSHASIRDGIRLSFAAAFSFHHNDLNDLEKKLQTANGGRQKFVVTESVFSMDGDVAPLRQMVDVCKKYDAALIVDEAHATGIIGERGEGLVQKLNLQNEIFARIHTFGKACGAHGAVVLGSSKLKKYLINFSRQFIYSTSLPPVSAEAISVAYKLFPLMHQERKHLRMLIETFQAASSKYKILKSDTPIQAIVIPGNDEVKALANICRQNNFDIRPILYPTVPKGMERLRIVLHSFNTSQQVQSLVALFQ
ncbi:8-amino-7-oxononanoate synthase [Hanamia caeni]|uniref:8-amino-7-oxononanoate synthase n=1 Tax=Hanamia caeni TaxID=2294116 RepID=A0A3M9N797_9BACT|nr:8-amino-7-oxononanoate synthase [Hanamia caeni]RNI33694.1 8-amino-7-oxononanoate synthase [Hanamia caeni]